MQWTIPGTTLTAERGEAGKTDGMFEALFLAGGLTLSQVASITGLEPYTVQNWVKRHFLPPPKGKRYSMEQLCRLININILKGAMPLEQIQHLMEYLNGNLADEGDDLVDDTMLFFFFVKLAANARHIGGNEKWEDALETVTADYKEPIPGARDKLKKVLQIMLTVWVANQLKAQADTMIAAL